MCLRARACLTRSSPVLYRQLSVGKLLRWVELGLLDATQVITMKVRVCVCVGVLAEAQAHRWWLARAQWFEGNARWL
jgi:hypothetical protein